MIRLFLVVIFAASYLCGCVSSQMLNHLQGGRTDFISFESSTIEQRAKYVSNSLGVLLEGWNTDLIDFNLSSEETMNFYGPSSSNGNPYNHYTVRFLGKQDDGKKVVGSVKLIEENSKYSSEFRERNSTSQELEATVGSEVFRLSLSQQSGTEFFGFNLNYDDLQISSSGKITKLSTPLLLKYVRHQLKTFLDPHGHKIKRGSIDIKETDTDRTRWEFQDRSRFAVTYYTIDANSDIHRGWAKLWVSSANTHQPVNFERNSTVRSLTDPSGNSHELWLQFNSGYLPQDAAWEPEFLDFHLDRVHSP